MSEKWNYKKWGNQADEIIININYLSTSEYLIYAKISHKPVHVKQTLSPLFFQDSETDAKSDLLEINTLLCIYQTYVHLRHNFYWIFVWHHGE